jgi:nitrogen-specific signal transduction histidine kinase
MRADTHYVDQPSGGPLAPTIHLLNVKALQTPKTGAAGPSDLLVASIRRHSILQPLLIQKHSGRYRVIDGRKRLAAAVIAGVDRVPCLLHEVDDGDAAALTEAVSVVAEEPSRLTAPPSTVPTFSDEVAESLAAVAGAAQLLSRSSGSLSRLAALNLINAEMWRAECLLDSTRLLDGKRRVASHPSSPIGIVEETGRRIAAEARLHTARVELRTNDVPAATQVNSDEELVVRALSLLAISTLVWLENVPDARITIRTALRGTRSVAFEVFQNAVAVPAAWCSTLASPAEQADAAVPGAKWMLGARRIAEALGGQVSVSAAGAVGTVMGLTLAIARE